jgi:hypothetical protein
LQDDLIQCIDSQAKDTALAFEFSTSNSELNFALRRSYCQFLNNANDKILVKLFIFLDVLEILGIKFRTRLVLQGSFSVASFRKIFGLELVLISLCCFSHGVMQHSHLAKS